MGGVLTRSEQLPPEQYSITIHRLVPLSQEPWYLLKRRKTKERIGEQTERVGGRRARWIAMVLHCTGKTYLVT